MSVTRRSFLQQTLGGAGVISLGPGLPAFWQSAAAANEKAPGENVLVVVQLSGGNDGLNTVVPYTDETYYARRPKLAIPADTVLKIDDHLGWHPELRGCADLLEDGHLAIVQNVGYPEPNRSHFESMDIWHTCRRKSERREDGWLGRYLDAARAGAGGDAPAIHLGAEKQPLALAARDVRSPSIRSLERFRLRTGEGTELQAAIAELTAARREQSDDLLSFVQSSTTAAVQASRRVEEAVRDYQPGVDYPDSGLSEKLKVVAQLIDSGLSTRVYYVALDGFDTHSQQPDAHAALLREFGGAVHAFLDDVASHGHDRRVMVMGFSEFGRRVEENASDGTDHGAAAPLFLAGRRVQAGPFGDAPDLTDLQDGDIKHRIDFRQVYATVLEQWLNWPSREILGGEYEALPLITA